MKSQKSLLCMSGWWAYTKAPRALYKRSLLIGVCSLIRSGRKRRHKWKSCRRQWYFVRLRCFLIAFCFSRFNYANCGSRRSVLSAATPAAHAKPSDGRRWRRARHRSAIGEQAGWNQNPHYAWVAPQRWDFSSPTRCSSCFSFFFHKKISVSSIKSRRRTHIHTVSRSLFFFEHIKIAPDKSHTKCHSASERHILGALVASVRSFSRSMVDRRLASSAARQPRQPRPEDRRWATMQCTRRAENLEHPKKLIFPAFAEKSALVFAKSEHKENKFRRRKSVSVSFSTI